MAIYRGAGGAGDATNDATSQAIFAAQSAVAAAQSEAAAAASAVSSSASAASAANSASNAATSETNAAASATNAANSATAAAASKTAAEAAQAAAETAETNAETAATNAATSATNAANSATSATTSANDAHSYSLSAASSAATATTQAGLAGGSATAAATSEANAAVSETNAATSETNAATSATDAASSASSASTSASTATTQATNASNSASAAATSATNAANSATSASTSASTATTQATNAATSATNSANSATASASSATNAATSAAAAAASLDSFDDRYLGSKTADPTLDNDGNALVTGALYYNSVAGEMRVYDGSLWIPASAATQAILTVYRYTATAGQTTFSGNADNSLSLAYTVGSAIVTLNGVTLEVGTDVTATTGTSIVLAVGAAAGDEVNIYAFSTFDVANTYTQAQANALLAGKVNTTGTESIAGIKTFTSRPLFSAGIDLNSNGQIKFPATQSASSDANTLDDYEEGAWTPVPVPAAGSITSYTSAGYYTKVGRQVTVEFTITITNVGTGITLSSITGLPYTNNYGAAAGCGREAGVTGNQWQYVINAGANTAYGVNYANSATLATSYILYGTITYFT